MQILVIQHDAADPPAHAQTVAEELGHTLAIVRLDRGDSIPATVGADMLMTFGGGISLTAPDLPDWVAREQNLIRLYADAGRRVLGICLGSQLVASALGATVRPNGQPEVGWYPVEPTGEPASAISGLFSHSPVVFQWHQDTFGIPVGAIHLLRSETCDHQAFTIDDRIVGLQFHLEANERTVNTFLAVSKLWRQDATFVQNEKEITDGIQIHLPNQNKLMTQLMRLMTGS